jgi:hypothetical protein
LVVLLLSNQVSNRTHFLQFPKIQWPTSPMPFLSNNLLRLDRPRVFNLCRQEAPTPSANLCSWPSKQAYHHLTQETSTVNPQTRSPDHHHSKTLLLSLKTPTRLSKHPHPSSHSNKQPLCRRHRPVQTPLLAMPRCNRQPRNHDHRQPVLHLLLKPLAPPTPSDRAPSSIITPARVGKRTSKPSEVASIKSQLYPYSLDQLSRRRGNNKLRRVSQHYQQHSSSFYPHIRTAVLSATSVSISGCTSSLST